MRTRTRVRLPTRRDGSDWRLLRPFWVVVASFVVLTCGFQPTGSAQPVQEPQGAVVIVGAVADEHHVPVARAQVQAFSAEDVRRASNSAQRLGRSAGSASTDETGTFRITGLAAGAYVIAAEAIPRFPSGGPASARLYGPTFYPSTLEVSQAVFVSALDRQAATVHIELVPVTPVRVTGTVASASGHSTEGLDVKLFRSFGSFGSGATVAVVGAQGAFEIPRVPPGRYRTDHRAAHVARGSGAARVRRHDDRRERPRPRSPAHRRAGCVSHRSRRRRAVGAITTPIGWRVTADTDARTIRSRTADCGGRECRLVVQDDGPLRLVQVPRLVGSAAADGRRDASRHRWDVVPREPRHCVGRRRSPPRHLRRSARGAEADCRHDADFECARRTVPERKGVLETDRDRQSDRRQTGRDACCRGSPTGLAIRIAISAATSRSFSQASAIRADCRRSPRFSPTDRSDPRARESPSASSDGRYRFERQVAADRYYAAHLLGDLAGFARSRPARAPARRSRDAVNRAVVARTDRRPRRPSRPSSQRSTTTTRQPACW